MRESTIPVVVYDVDSYKSRILGLYGVQPYSFHRFALRWRGLSSQQYSLLITLAKAHQYRNFRGILTRANLLLFSLFRISKQAVGDSL